MVAPVRLQLKSSIDRLLGRAGIRQGTFYLLLLAQLLYLVLGIKRAVNVYDEGLILYGASRVLFGDMPYRDFWTVYGPAQFYLLAALFKVFGTSLLIARLADTLARITLSLAAYLIARQLLPAQVAVLAWVAVTLLLGPTAPEVTAASFYGYPVFPALALALLSLLLLIRFFPRPRAGPLLLSGALAGCATAFRQDIGLFFIVCSSLVLAAFTLSSPQPARDDTLRRKPMPTVALFLVAACLPALLAYLPFIIHVGPLTLWGDLVAFPATRLLQERALPYPSLLPPDTAWQSARHLLNYFYYRWGAFYIPLLVYVLSSGRIFFVARRAGMQPTHWSLLLLTLSGAALFIQGLNRSDHIHLLPTNVIAIILIAHLLWTALGAWHRRSYTMLVTILIPAIAIPYLVLPVGVWWSTIQSRSFLWPPGCLVRGGCPGMSPSQLQVIDLIQRHTADNERIYVGLGRHDRIQINDIAFYFFAERHSATRYHELHPGSATTRPVQQTIIQELQAHSVRYIVLFGRPPLDHEYTPAGSRLLDDFVRNHYRMVYEASRYTIWLSNEEPVPPDLIQTENVPEHQLR